MPGHSNAKKSGPSGSLFCILGTSSTGDESGVSITQGVVVSAFAGSFRAEEEPRCFVTAFSIGKICAIFMRFSMQRTNYVLSAFRDRKYVHLEDNADQSAVREAFVLNGDFSSGHQRHSWVKAEDSCYLREHCFAVSKRPKQHEFCRLGTSSVALTIDVLSACYGGKGVVCLLARSLRESRSLARYCEKGLFMVSDGA